MTPPDEITDNIFEMTEDEREKAGIDSLPGNLSDALDELEKDDLMKETLGEHVYTQYLLGKRKEWDEYRTQVTRCEIANYMVTY